MEKSYPKMSKAQAKLFWKSLTPQQRIDFNKMMEKMAGGKLELKTVLVDDNEQIQRIILDERKAPVPAAPFYKHFNIKD